MQLNVLLAIFLVVIIIGLAFYVVILLYKIKVQKANKLAMVAEQKKQQTIGQQQRNDTICESIRVIALATAQKQCNVSEAAIRLTVLLEALLLEQPIDLINSYPALSEMFDKVKDMPTHDERKKVPVKELKALDKKREKLESELEQQIMTEAQQLANFSV
ncbi:conserved hypothetical protein [Psychromonas ingrahamii 37]|uniref:DUF2489 domain-containing protein n=1 Tax=Psychromonas ingrahamii (strain DSM 17664 / CCUG 51855 / 37) TaxID=357804 RepID=A1SRG0_PSYIN|nr:DUF2489 domain-containing protein [Psychromonas ingrahamii]ABM02075.1 conserved hypothetical protein [Psychromonas ingrahamii 37]